MMDRLQPYFTGDSKPSADEVTNAFWNACHGGQLEAARYLLALSFLTQQRHRPTPAPDPRLRRRTLFDLGMISDCQTISTGFRQYLS
jgi:hypothetical protein